MSLISSTSVISSIKSTISVLLLMALWPASHSLADWSGAINQKTLLGRPFGQLVATSETAEKNTLNVVCFEEDSFWLYLDSEVTSGTSPSNIVVTVDQLTPIDLAFELKGENYTITNRGTGFWMLIAQMSAGAILNVDSGDGKLHQYSLVGFTKAYLDSCDWMDSADMYNSYLDRYQ